MAKIYENEHRESHCSRTISELFQEWHSSILYRVKESTAANYMMKATRHILPMFGNKQVDMLVQDDVYHFIVEKQKEGLSNRYITDIIILMKTLFKYAVRTYHIFNPLDGIILPKRRKQKSSFLMKQSRTLYSVISPKIRIERHLALHFPCQQASESENFVPCSGRISTLKNGF